MSEITQEIMDRAARESGLAEEYREDPKLRAFYMRKLLKPGWAGERSGTEKKYCRLVYHLRYTNLAHAHEEKEAV